MKAAAEQVAEFMEVFGQAIPDKPVIPAEKIRALRDSLIEEENGELRDAKTPVEALDAIADLLYVVLGAGAAYGFTPDQIEAAFKEVHRSNMSKLWTDKEVHDLEFGRDVTTAGDVSGDFHNRFDVVRQFHGSRSNPKTCVLLRKLDGKVLKSPSYSPANLEAIVNG